MHVVHRLTTVVTRVQNCAVSRARQVLCPSNVTRGEHHFAQNISMVVPRHLERGDVFRGDDEDVDGRLRANIAKGEHILGAVHNIGRDLTRDNPAEEAIRVAHETIRREKESGLYRSSP